MHEHTHPPTHQHTYARTHTHTCRCKLHYANTFATIIRTSSSWLRQLGANVQRSEQSAHHSKCRRLSKSYSHAGAIHRTGPSPPALLLPLPPLPPHTAATKPISPVTRAATISECFANNNCVFHAQNCARGLATETHPTARLLPPPPSACEPAKPKYD